MDQPIYRLYKEDDKPKAMIGLEQKFFDFLCKIGQDFEWKSGKFRSI